MSAYSQYFTSHKLYTYSHPKWSNLIEWMHWTPSQYDGQQCFIYNDTGTCEAAVVMFADGSMMNVYRSNLNDLGVLGEKLS